MEAVKRGKLTTGKDWHCVPCAKPDGGLIEGRHIILETVNQDRPDNLLPEELTELRLLAFKLADELASEPGRWRVDFNGPNVATSAHFHAHIKLPAGQDKLARLVG